jgi:hypothetical protein
MLAAERSYGKVNQTYPLIDDFNKTVAFVIADGKTYILDASQKYLPAGLTPYQLLNTYGLIIDRKQGKIIEINSTTEAFKSNVSFSASLDKSGKLSGQADIKSYEYARQLQMESILENMKNYVADHIQKPHEGLIIEDFSFERPAANKDALSQRVKFSTQFSESGGFILLNYNLFTGLSKNPFTANERFTNVNFGYPYKISVEGTIELPANAKVDNLPPTRTLVTPEKEIIIRREIKKEGNTIKVKIEFNQTLTLVPNTEYNELKEFYRQMVEFINEPVVVKLQ